MNWLERVGTDIVDFFKKAEPVIAEVQTIATPIENYYLPGLSSIINIGLQQVANAEALGATAAAGQDTSTQKLAAVTSSLATSLGPILQSYGVTTPTTAQYQIF